MATVGAIPTQFWVLSSPNKTILSKSPPKSLKSPLLNTSLSLTFSPLLLTQKHFSPTFALSSSSVGSTEYAEERTTKVKFRKSLSLPGCSTSLSLIGTGYREKIFGILGVKVYAVGFYTNQTIFTELKSWKGRSAAQVQHDRSIFDTIFQAPTEKSLQIVLVRDVDGKNFWAAVDEAVSPRIKSPTKEDESALSTFRKLFQSLSIKKGTFVYLTWLNPSKIIVSVSSDEIPSRVDATIESLNVTSALFDVFLGAGTVSPSLKASVSDNIAVALK